MDIHNKRVWTTNPDHFRQPDLLQRDRTRHDNIGTTANALGAQIRRNPPTNADLYPPPLGRTDHPSSVRSTVAFSKRTTRALQAKAGKLTHAELNGPVPPVNESLDAHVLDRRQRVEAVRGMNLSRAPLAEAEVVPSIEHAASPALFEQALQTHFGTSDAADVDRLRARLLAGMVPADMLRRRSPAMMMHTLSRLGGGNAAHAAACLDRLARGLPGFGAPDAGTPAVVREFDIKVCAMLCRTSLGYATLRSFCKPPATAVDAPGRASAIHAAAETYYQCRLAMIEGPDVAFARQVAHVARRKVEGAKSADLTKAQKAAYFAWRCNYRADGPHSLLQRTREGLFDAATTSVDNLRRRFDQHKPVKLSPYTGLADPLGGGSLGLQQHWDTKQIAAYGLKFRECCVELRKLVQARQAVAPSLRLAVFDGLLGAVLGVVDMPDHGWHRQRLDLDTLRDQLMASDAFKALQPPPSRHRLGVEVKRLVKRLPLDGGRKLVLLHEPGLVMMRRALGKDMNMHMDMDMDQDSGSQHEPDPIADGRGDGPGLGARPDGALGTTAAARLHELKGLRIANHLVRRTRDGVADGLSSLASAKDAQRRAWKSKDVKLGGFDGPVLVVDPTGASTLAVPVPIYFTWLKTAGRALGVTTGTVGYKIFIAGARSRRHGIGVAAGVGAHDHDALLGGGTARGGVSRTRTIEAGPTIHVSPPAEAQGFPMTRRKGREEVEAAADMDDAIDQLLRSAPPPGATPQTHFEDFVDRIGEDHERVSIGWREVRSKDVRINVSLAAGLRLFIGPAAGLELDASLWGSMEVHDLAGRPRQHVVQTTVSDFQLSWFAQMGLMVDTGHGKGVEVQGPPTNGIGDPFFQHGRVEILQLTESKHGCYDGRNCVHSTVNKWGRRTRDTLRRNGAAWADYLTGNEAAFDEQLKRFTADRTVDEDFTMRVQITTTEQLELVRWFIECARGAAKDPRNTQDVRRMHALEVDFQRILASPNSFTQKDVLRARNVSGSTEYGPPLPIKAAVPVVQTIGRKEVDYWNPGAVGAGGSRARLLNKQKAMVHRHYEPGTENKDWLVGRLPAEAGTASAPPDPRIDSPEARAERIRRGLVARPPRVLIVKKPTAAQAVLRAYVADVRKMGVWNNDSADLFLTLMFELPELADVQGRLHFRVRHADGTMHRLRLRPAIDALLPMPAREFNADADAHRVELFRIERRDGSGAPTHHHEFVKDGKRQRVATGGDSLYRAMLEALPAATYRNLAGQDRNDATSDPPQRLPVPPEAVRALRDRLADWMEDHTEAWSDAVLGDDPEKSARMLQWVTQVRRPDVWNTESADVVMAMMFQLPELADVNGKLHLRVRGSNGKLRRKRFAPGAAPAVPRRPEVFHPDADQHAIDLVQIRILDGEGHTSYHYEFMRDGRRQPVAEDGDCMFRAMLEAMPAQAYRRIVGEERADASGDTSGEASNDAAPGTSADRGDGRAPARPEIPREAVGALRHHLADWMEDNVDHWQDFALTANGDAPVAAAGARPRRTLMPRKD